MPTSMPNRAERLPVLNRREFRKDHCREIQPGRQGRRCREIQDAGAEGSRPAGKAVGAEIEWHNENVQ
jgi:hypothetical protein